MLGRVGALVVVLAVAGCDESDGCDYYVEIDFPCTGYSVCLNSLEIQTCGTATCHDLGYDRCCDGASCITAPPTTCPSGTVCMERVYPMSNGVEAECVKVPDGGTNDCLDGGWRPPLDGGWTCGEPRFPREAGDAGADAGIACGMLGPDVCSSLRDQWAGAVGRLTTACTSTSDCIVVGGAPGCDGNPYIAPDCRGVAVNSEAYWSSGVATYVTSPWYSSCQDAGPGVWDCAQAQPECLNGTCVRSAACQCLCPGPEDGGADGPADAGTD